MDEIPLCSTTLAPLCLGALLTLFTRICLISREDNAKELLRRKLQKAQTAWVCLHLGAPC